MSEMMDCPTCGGTGEVTIEEYDTLMEDAESE
jgi:hypothetical protein